MQKGWTWAQSYGETAYHPWILSYSKSLILDDLIHTLNGTTVVSNLNLWSGYHQIMLDAESGYITIFATYQGLLIGGTAD